MLCEALAQTPRAPWHFAASDALVIVCVFARAALRVLAPAPCFRQVQQWISPATLELIIDR
eukprot:2153806-Lingulodinium_polyedra.AAC.1